MYAEFEKLMSQNGMRIADVVRATGVAQSTISDWKAGRYTPKHDKLKAIADLFGVSVEYLEKGSAENPTDYPENVKELARFLSENPAYAKLFQSARMVKPTDIDLAEAILERFC